MDEEEGEVAGADPTINRAAVGVAGGEVDLDAVDVFPTKSTQL